MTGITRRAVLAHGGLAAGVATTAALGWTTGRADVAEGPLQRFVVSDLRILGPRNAPVIGGARVLHGSLRLAEGGAEIGTLHATSTVVALPDLLDAQIGFLETHLLTLPAGTIAAVGTVQHDGFGRFTITGGSGRFASLRGGYDSHQFADHAGLGSATFDFETENPWHSPLT